MTDLETKIRRDRRSYAGDDRDLIIKSIKDVYEKGYSSTRTQSNRATTKVKGHEIVVTTLRQYLTAAKKKYNITPLESTEIETKVLYFEEKKRNAAVEMDRKIADRYADLDGFDSE